MSGLECDACEVRLLEVGRAKAEAAALRESNRRMREAIVQWRRDCECLCAACGELAALAAEVRRG